MKNLLIVVPGLRLEKFSYAAYRERLLRIFEGNDSGYGR